MFATTWSFLRSGKTASARLREFPRPNEAETRAVRFVALRRERVVWNGLAEALARTWKCVSAGDGDEHLPIELGPVSNGEYDPPPVSPVLRETARRTRALLDDRARRLGISRRDFLRTSMATAAALLVLDACSDEDRRSRDKPAGGRLRIPDDATTEPTLSRPRATEFVMDVQTHFLDFSAHPDALSFGAGFPQANCGDADGRMCFSIDHFLEEVFLKSDTTLAVLSAIPVAPSSSPLTIDDMEHARRIAERVCENERLLLHGQALPAIGSLDAQLAAMDDLVADHPIAAWKIYTHAPARGWYLDDHDGSRPQVGNAFLEKVQAIGPRIVCVHKGFGGGSPYASPVDIGPAARAHPDIAIVVYHSGYEAGNREGPYRPDGNGVDRLVRSLRDAGVGPGRNVYAELGSTWFNVMRDPDQAAHTLGKVLRAVGPDNVLWGTDSIWYGSPQVQIDAFRAFEISAQYQETYSYPALTPELKRKILGPNAARLYGVTPPTTACRFTPGDIEQARAALPVRPASYGPRTAEAVRVLAREHGWIGF
jgi:predicted TIM-barrel fold metal-dependent hydrolase